MNELNVIEISRAAPRISTARTGSPVLGFLAVFGFLVLLGQAALVVHARPQDLVTGVHGMADFLSRSFPLDFSRLNEAA